MYVCKGKVPLEDDGKLHIGRIAFLYGIFSYYIFIG